jgi:hypothetical protein
MKDAVMNMVMYSAQTFSISNPVPSVNSSPEYTNVVVTISLMSRCFTKPTATSHRWMNRLCTST